ncbi:MAG: ATP-binding protein [Candidatus Omnitrophota bacterium]
MNLFAISGLLITLTSVVLIAILSVYGKNKLHRLWTVFNFSLIFLGFSLFKIGTSVSPGEALIWWKVASVSGGLLAPLFLNIIYIFCNLPNRKILYSSYLPVSIFIMLDFMNLGTYRLRFIYGPFYYLELTGFVLPLFLCLWAAILIYAFYALYKFYVSSKGLVRNQAVFILVGFFFGFIGGGTYLLTTFAHILFGKNIYPFGQTGIVIYSTIITYAIIKYRLLDIKVAITRTGIFVAVYTLVLGLPFLIAIWAKGWLIETFGPEWWILPLGLMGILATVGPFVYIYVQRKAEDALLKEQKHYQHILKQASIGMTRIRNLRKLLDLITRIVTKIVKISYAAIYLYDKETGDYILQISRDKHRISVPKLTSDNPLITWIRLKREPLIYDEIKRQTEYANNPVYKQLEENMLLLTASVVIPSFLEDRFMGFFVLSDKISGQIYTEDDLNVFQVLASQTALAVENAQFYEEAKDMQEQVAQAEKMATIGTMADGLSHQLNNRFYALSLIAGDIMDTIKMTNTSKCTPEVKEMIRQINYAFERIQANVTQGGQVVRGLLKYSRKGEAGFEAISLNTLIDNTLEMVQFKVRLSEIDIIRDFPEDIPKIKGNIVQLEEAFFNFIDNAYDAILERHALLKEEHYKGKIIISSAAKNNYLEIIIKDNGMGIKQEDHEKIFTPFFTTKVSARKGTGLGLYVIRRIISDMHKGRISFESEYKAGTKFLLELPIAR